MEGIETLRKICALPGVPGYESAIRNYIKSQLENIADRIEIDPMGNLIAFHQGRNHKKLMLSAHLDEIGFMVQHIDEDGFIRFVPLGGFDAKTLTAQRVTIHGKKDVIGVMGSKPIHLMTAEERTKAPQVKDYFIDTGLPAEEVKKLIQVGDPITRERELIQMGPCINAKSLDNRISVFILLKIFQEIKRRNPDLNVLAVFTVQEEVGLRGAKTVAHKLAPDLAINIDTTIAFDVPGAQSHEMVSRLGQGVGIKIMDHSVLCDYRMVRLLKETATKHKIKWQAEILQKGGTDTASIQMAGGGCIAGAVSIPTRHIHQVIEMVHQADVQASIDLVLAAIPEIESMDWNHAQH
ncbi:MAG: M42 family metallopeptidase [Saprospiraceae bacterium]|nr:M42 family metallopeptidase [Saprospiraceae bacterium]